VFKTQPCHRWLLSILLGLTVLLTAGFGDVVGLIPRSGSAPQSITRESVKFSVSLTTSEATSTEVVFAYTSGGTIFIPTGSAITSLTYYASPTSRAEGGTYLPLSDADGAAVTQTVTGGRAYDMPSALFGCRYIKIVVNAAGTVAVCVKG
jgi:hypothetical protein